MKQLLDQTRGQVSSLRHLIEIFESERQEDMCRFLKESIEDIRKALHCARSIRSLQGVNDDQSSFNQSAAYGLIPSYEGSSAYQRAEDFAADYSLTKKAGMLSENYMRGEKLEGLLLDVDWKGKKVAQLENATVLKDEKIARLENNILSKNDKVALLENNNVLNDEKGTQLENHIFSQDEKVARLQQDILRMHEEITRRENDILSKDEKVSRLEQDILWMNKEVSRLEQDFMLEHNRIGMLERDLSLKDFQLLSTRFQILELKIRSMLEVELNGLEDDNVVNWLVKNCKTIALHQY